MKKILTTVFAFILFLGIVASATGQVTTREAKKALKMNPPEKLKSKQRIMKKTGIMWLSVLLPLDVS